MQVKEFVNSGVETIQSNDTLQRAAEKMRHLDVGSLPVCKGGELNAICTTSCGFTHRHSFISSAVRAHTVRFFSGRFENGHFVVRSPVSCW